MIKKDEKLDDITPLEEALFTFRLKFLEMMREEASSLNFPISQLDALSFIAEKGNPSMKEIARHLNIRPPSATAMIEIMQNKGLVDRIANNKDRRKIRITLTPQAWDLFRALKERKLKILKKMLSKLKVEEQKQFIKIINILIKD